MSQTEQSDIKGMIIVKRPRKGGRYVANWRVHRPVIDYENCTGCMLCDMYCPEAAIQPNEEGKPEIDWRFCKGCGVCANECPTGSIEMIKEEK
ncbi:MAG: 4Fe-4S binding protein [Candidatus Bathyarchaeota archaeon]